MSKSSIDEIFAQLRPLIEDLFPDSDTEIVPSTTAPEIRGWDSLAHAVLLANVERHFGIELPPDRSLLLASVGDLATLVHECL